MAKTPNGTLLDRSASAPFSKSIRTRSIWPARAATARAVSPPYRVHGKKRLRNPQQARLGLRLAHHRLAFFVYELLYVSTAEKNGGTCLVPRVHGDNQHFLGSTKCGV